MTTSYVDNAALFAVLSSLADNKQAIGRRYAYWCNGAPALEAAVAAAAIKMSLDTRVPCIPCSKTSRRDRQTLASLTP